MSVPVQWRISIKMRSDVAALLSMPINVDRSSEKPPAAILTLRIETVIAPI